MTTRNPFDRELLGKLRKEMRGRSTKELGMVLVHFSPMLREGTLTSEDGARLYVTREEINRRADQRARWERLNR